MTNYTIANMSSSIEKMITPDGVIVNSEANIADFVKNSERQFFAALQAHVEKINTAIPEKNVTTTCDSCKEQYVIPFTFDQSNFFAYAS